VNLKISLLYGVIDGLKKLSTILMALFFFGCGVTLPASEPRLQHETSEPELMTEQEFTDRSVQSALLIYEGMRTVSEAAQKYALDNNDTLPISNPQKTVKELLLEGGYLKSWPTVPPFAFTDPTQLELTYANGYDDMDGIGAPDDVIFLQDVKIEVCKEFIRRHSSAGPDDIIYNYKANKEKYPGEVFGRHIKIYAINWPGEEYNEYCDIEWVIQYND